MSKLTIFFGILLIVISAEAYFTTGHHPHALIPGVVGVILAILGSLANNPDPKRRMLFMHIAVTVGLLGFLGTIPGIFATIRRMLGQVVASPTPAAATVQTLMGTFCLIYVLLCVRSFIAARRLRNSNS